MASRKTVIGRGGSEILPRTVYPMSVAVNTTGTTYVFPPCNFFSLRSAVVSSVSLTGTPTIQFSKNNGSGNTSLCSAQTIVSAGLYKFHRDSGKSFYRTTSGVLSYSNNYQLNYGTGSKVLSVKDDSDLGSSNSKVAIGVLVGGTLTAGVISVTLFFDMLSDEL